MTEKKARNAVTGTRKKPPADAAETLLELAASGYNKKGLAYRLGTTVETLNKWLEIHPELQRALDEGREREHHALFNALYENATKGGNVTAAIFLLKARHGYREGDQSEIANKVSINFQLPGALRLEDFARDVTPSKGSLSHDN
ncbi:MAG: hypothetical protein CMK99_12725 [Pseudomonas sp.]|nr:hypothetical protein [Pseudomonas sp.]HBS77791.1 hypothetical protein [Pseudomonas sp.]|tara:strand:+ start:15153 stop:15584 length:432 start_codon:yes stop_codon:yes gene_type:complete